MAIINNEDATNIIDLLNESNFSVTKLASTGGFLRAGNTTLISGVSEDKITKFINIIETECKSRKKIRPVSPPASAVTDGYMPFPMEVRVGGATIFVLNIDSYTKI
jgi:uncharacterized protein YaaQ